MSRVVAMISGDIEASGEITRPEYLTGFSFNDATTFKSAVPASSTTSGGDGMASTSNSTASPSLLSPLDIYRPMLYNIKGEGR